MTMKFTIAPIIICAALVLAGCSGTDGRSASAASQTETAVQTVSPDEAAALVSMKCDAALIDKMNESDEKLAVTVTFRAAYNPVSVEEFIGKYSLKLNPPEQGVSPFVGNGNTYEAVHCLATPEQIRETAAVSMVKSITLEAEN